jgi:hypothetical protein
MRSKYFPRPSCRMTSLSGKVPELRARIFLSNNDDKLTTSLNILCEQCSSLRIKELTEYLMISETRDEEWSRRETWCKEDHDVWYVTKIIGAIFDMRLK